MTIEEKILSKLEPHARRIREGQGNDFDYLPAVLLQLIEEQKRQTKLLDDTASLLNIIKSTGASAQAAHAKQVNESLSAIGLKIESFSSNTLRSHVYFKLMLIAGLVALAALIALAVVILQRH